MTKIEIETEIATLAQDVLPDLFEALESLQNTDEDDPDYDLRDSDIEDTEEEIRTMQARLQKLETMLEKGRVTEQDSTSSQGKK